MRFSKPNKKQLLRYRNRPFTLNAFRLTFLTLSLFFFYLFFSESRTFPPTWPDEVLFFSPSQQLANTGTLRTDVLVGLIPGMESKTLWMTPGYLLLSSGFLKIFPQTLLTVRCLSFFSIYLSAFLLVILLFRFKFNKVSIIIAFATMIMEPLFFRFGIPARMEGATILFFIASLLLASSNLHFLIKSILAGLFFGCSVMTHPFAASLGLIPLYLLIYDNPKRMGSLCTFFIGVGIPVIGWIYYIYPDWELFVVQFGAQLERKKALFSTFDLITKLKIFMFGFAYAKIRIFIITFQVFLISLLSYQRWTKGETLPKRYVLYWIWMLSVILSIYSSSEGWYVIHFLFPFALGMAIISEQKVIGVRLALFGILISLAGWLHFIYLHHIKYNSEQILNEHFEKVYTSIGSSHKIYIQAIPDPYFYLKAQNPNLQILEFIPGELSIPSEVFKQTISEQDAFIFYNEDLINVAIKELLDADKDWIREEWTIPVPPQHWLAFKTIIYRKPK